jgi:hypothetical protein
MREEKGKFLAHLLIEDAVILSLPLSVLRVP